jgi:hypothetical protein
MKPILFSTEMVSAILAGRKSQTRRVIPEKVQDEYSDYDDYVTAVAFGVPHVRHNEKSFYLEKARYKPGDVLWVRETFARHGIADFALKGKVNPEKNPEFDDGTIMGFGNYIYKADEYEPYDNTYKITWKPSIFMPKEAARILLRVTDVRAERLQEISREDVIAEGFVLSCDNGRGDGIIRCSAYPCAFNETSCINKFSDYWDKQNAKRGFGWDTNPWCWVYEFKRIDKEEAQND